MMSKTIIFFGTEAFSATSLQALIDAGFNIAAVVTKPDTAKGRSKELTPSPVKILAQTHNIPVWQPENVTDITEKIENTENRVGILVSYGKLIPDDILALFEPIGIINVHPSLLPKYRGPSPIESSIVNGDTETGVSIMKLNSETDAGPVCSQTKIDLNGDESANGLYETLSKKGAEQLVATLPEILDGGLQPSEQSDDATFTKLIQKSDGIIDWNKPAQQIEREIRAYSIWPKSRSKLGEVEAIITAAHIVDGSDNPGKIMLRDNELIVRCGKDSLSIDGIQPLGKKEMPIQAFLAGYKNKIIVQ